jgi:hypothetical protein
MKRPFDRVQSGWEWVDEEGKRSVADMTTTDLLNAMIDIRAHMDGRHLLRHRYPRAYLIEGFRQMGSELARRDIDCADSAVWFKAGESRRWKQ